MLELPWGVSPESLEALDANIVRCISGVLTDAMTDELLGPKNFAVRRRIAALLAKHSTTSFSDLSGTDAQSRRALAERIIRAEIEEKQREAKPRFADSPIGFASG